MGWGPLSSQRSPKITGKGQPGLLSKLFFSYFVVFHCFSFLLFILTAAGADVAPVLLAVLFLFFLLLSEVSVIYNESRIHPIVPLR